MPRHKKLKSDYEKLRDIWYKKLKDSGFQDIENTKGEITVGLWHFAEDRYRSLLDTNPEYYRLASRLLYEHEFKNERERVIWEYHKNGLSIRQIEETLKKAKIKSPSKDAVRKTIIDLVEVMKKKYLVMKNHSD